MKVSPFDDLSQNCICVHIAFVELLLPILQFYVDNKMRAFFLKLFPTQVDNPAVKEVHKKAKKKRSKKRRVATVPYRILQLQLPLQKATQMSKKGQLKLSDAILF